MATLLSFFAGCFFSHSFFQVATVGDFAGDPVSLSESLLAFVVFLFVGCLFFCTVIYLPAPPYCIHVHMSDVSVGSVGLFVCWGGMFYEISPLPRLEHTHRF